MQNRLYLTGLICALAFNVSNGAFSQPVDTGTRLLLSYSTFISMAVEVTKRELLPDPYNFGYLPAGTWFKTLGSGVGNDENRKLLIHSETGAVGFISDGQYWNEYDIRRFRQNGRVAIFQKNHDHVVGIGEGRQFKGVIGFSRGESAVVVANSTEPEGSNTEVTIRFDLLEKLKDKDGKLVIPLTNLTLKKLPSTARIPRSVIRIIDFKDLGTEKLKFGGVIRKHIADGVIGLEKPCREEKTRTIKTSVGGGAEFKVETFFAKLGFGLSADRETEEIEVFEPSESVRRTYYKMKMVRHTD